MARQCEIPSDFRQKHGFSQEFLNSVIRGAGDVKLNKDQVQAIVKNLGIDDARAIELRDGKGHLFGKNLKDIEEFDPSKGNIPSNVLVKKYTKDGELQYFLSERSTDMPPSKWVITDANRILKNPDWTFIGKNATTDGSGALKRFSATEGNGAIFKEDPNGDTLLKVSKLYEGDNPKNLYSLAEKGYDGIRYSDGRVHVFDKAHQSVDPQKATIATKFEGVDKQVKQVEPDEKQLTKAMDEASIGGRAALTLGGALAGETFAEDYGGMWWGGAVGFALGVPKIRGSVTNILKGDKVDIKDRIKDLGVLQKASEMGVELKKYGYAGDMTDEQAKRTFKEKVVDEMKSLRAKGRAVKNLIFDSDYFKSGISRLEDMGIPTASKLRVALQRTESAHNPYMAIATDVLNEKYGVKISLDEFDQKQADVVANFIRQGGFDEQALKDEEFLFEQMGASIRRIITHEVELDNAGALKIGDERYVTENVYNKEAIQDFDKYVLQSEEGRRIVDAHREIFDRMGEKAYDSFSNALDNLRQNYLKGEASEVFEDFYTSGLSIKQWRQQASDDMIEAFNKARKADTKGKVFKEAVQFREKQLKIDNLRGKYIPQVQSHRKINQMKREFLENNVDANGKPLMEVSAKEQEQAWFDHYKKKIIAYNHDGFTVKGLDAGGGDVETIYFRTFENAIEKLRNQHAFDIQDDAVRRNVLNRLESEDPTVLDKFIGKKNVNGTDAYYLKKPDDLDYDNYLKDMNEDALGEAQKMFLNMATFKQSDFLDHARQFILPNDMLETNMRKVISRYARDVGVRTHLVDEGIGTQRQLEEVLSKVKTELKEREIGRDVTKELNSVKEWYASITNTKNMIEVDMKPDEILERARLDRHNNKIARTVMNLAAMPFMWFTSFYAPFTPAILGSYLSSPKNIMKAYGEIAGDPQALKSVTDNLYKYGAIEKKLRSVSEEAQFGDYGRDMLAGSDSAFLDWMFDISNKGINFSTRFSMGKRILSGMGVDVENAGALRLVTGDLYDITGAESAITSMAVLKEIEDMAEAGKKILDARSRGEELLEATGGGKTFRLGTVKRRLKELGIEKPEAFIDETMKETNGVRASQSFYNSLTGHGDKAEISGYLQNEYSRLMDTVINQYHGRTKLSRPLKWVDNVYGRVLSQFSVYAQNFGVQTVRRRMYQPLKDWSDKYRDDGTPLFQTYWAMQRNDTAKLKEIFGDQWKDAFDDFPIDAVDNIFKVTPIVMGVSTTMMMTRDSVMDMINMVSNEAMGNDNYEEWEKTAENYEEIRSLIDEGPTGYNMAKAVLGGLGQATQMGMFGRYAQVWRQAQYGDLAGATPATGMASELFNVMGEPFKHNLEDIPKATGKALTEYIMLRSPVIGTFNAPREGAVDAWFNQPKNKSMKTVDLDL